MQLHQETLARRSPDAGDRLQGVGKKISGHVSRQDEDAGVLMVSAASLFIIGIS